MNFHIIDTNYGQCVIGGGEQLSSNRLVRGYVNANRVLLSRKPLLLVYSRDLSGCHEIYDDLYITKFSRDDLSLDTFLFNDIVCAEMIDVQISDLSPDQFNDFLLSLSDTQKLSDWSDRGMLVLGLPLEQSLPPLDLSDNLGFPLS